MADANTVILVGKMHSAPVETPDGLMATIATEEISNDKAYVARNFIEVSSSHLVERLSGANIGDLLAITGKLQTKNKVTRVVVDHLERL